MRTSCYFIATATWLMHLCAVPDMLASGSSDTPPAVPADGRTCIGKVLMYVEWKSRSARNYMNAGVNRVTVQQLDSSVGTVRYACQHGTTVIGH
jgi:hypothetical protein